MITAGLMDDPREMVGRLTTLLSKVMTRINVEEKKESDNNGCKLDLKREFFNKMQPSKK